MKAFPKWETLEKQGRTSGVCWLFYWQLTDVAKQVRECRIQEAYVATQELEVVEQEVVVAEQEEECRTQEVYVATQEVKVVEQELVVLMQEEECRIQEAECGIQETEYRIQEEECGMQEGQALRNY